jgi:hypothetical protein
MGRRLCVSVIASCEVTLKEMARSGRMMIHRRDFIANAIAIGVAPTIQLLSAQQLSSAASQSRAVFMIHGWSIQDDRADADQAWITVSNSWRTAWR